MHPNASCQRFLSIRNCFKNSYQTICSRLNFKTASEAEYVPVKCINRVLLMRHEHLAGAMVELSETATTSFGAHCILHHPSEAGDGAEVMAALKPLQLRHRMESIAGYGCNETLTRNPNPLEDIVTMICYSRPRQFWSICTAVFVGVVSCLIGLPAS